MSDLETIRAAIKTKLESVTNIVNVHDYERYANRDSEFKALFYDAPNKIISGWWFDRLNTAELDGDTGEVRIIHTWQFYGYRSFDDANASAKAFQNKVEAITKTFRADPTLGGVIDDNKNMAQQFGPVGIQVDGIEPVMFFKYLCHRARLTLITETTEPKGI